MLLCLVVEVVYTGRRGEKGVGQEETRRGNVGRTPGAGGGGGGGDYEAIAEGSGVLGYVLALDLE